MQPLEFYLTERNHEAQARYFREYHNRRKYISLDERKELIESFGGCFPECLTLCILHHLYENEEERNYIMQKLLKHKRGASDLLPIFKENLFTTEERKEALEKIKNAVNLVQHWFLDDYYHATEEEKAYIRSHTPEMRSHWDCYMYLMHNHHVDEVSRERAFQSVLNRGILHYLTKMLTAPYVYNQAWVPSEKQKKIIEKRIKELRKYSRVYSATVVDGSKEIFQKFRDATEDKDSEYDSLYCVKIANRTKMFCYPTGWTPQNTFTGKVLNVRLKDNRIIEIIEE